MNDNWRPAEERKASREAAKQRRLAGAKAYSRSLVVMKQRHLKEYREVYYPLRRGGMVEYKARYKALMTVAMRHLVEWDEVKAAERKKLGLE